MMREGAELFSKLAGQQREELLVRRGVEDFTSWLGVEADGPQLMERLQELCANELEEHVARVEGESALIAGAFITLRGG